ncbi:MAG: ATP-grasp domain-containing protein [Thermoanaerobaculia bacterium]
MPQLTTIPDAETIVGLIKELAALLTGQSPHVLDDATDLDALGLRGPRMGALLGGIQGSFGVTVPPSQLRADVRTVGQLAQTLGAIVHGALCTRIPIGPAARSARRVLIVGGGASKELAEAAARRGWRAAMLTQEDATLRVGALGVIDMVEIVDWARPLDIVQRIVDLYAAGHIERVVPIDEFGLLPAALATSQLGIPGPSLRAVRNTRDKLHMRRVLEQAGLGQLHYAACRDLAEAQAFLERVGGPIILKPVSGTGSDGVSRVANGEELAVAFALAAGARGFSGVLCEEYIDGPEVSLEGYSADGRFTPVALTDKRTDEHFVEIGHQQPSVQPQGLFEATAEIAGRALAALGVENGVTHTEFRLAARGPVLIETHTRMGGDQIPVLTQLTTGVDLADLMVAFSIGEPVEARPVPQGRAAAIRFFMGRPGRVGGVRVPSMKTTDGIHSVLGPAIGKSVTGRSASPQRLGHVIATGLTPVAAADAAESFMARIRIEYFENDPGAVTVDRTAASEARVSAPPAS